MFTSPCDFGLVRPVDRFDGCVIVTVADAADESRPFDPSISVADGHGSSMASNTSFVGANGLSRAPGTCPVAPRVGYTDLGSTAGVTADRIEIL